MSDTVTITLDREKAIRFLGGDEVHVSAFIEARREIIAALRAALATPDQPQVPSVPPVVYVREQEGTETELFATVEEAMDGGYEFEGDHDASAGDPWYADCSSESGIACRWSACPVGEPAVYIHEHEIPPGCLAKAAQQVPSVPLGDEERERLQKIIRRVEIHARASKETVRPILERDATFLRKLAEHPSSEGDQRA